MSERNLAVAAAFVGVVVLVVGTVYAFASGTFELPTLLGFVLAMFLTVIGGICATSFAGPNLAAIGVTPDDRLLVRPVGLMRFWALSKGIDVPVLAITSVGVAKRGELKLGFRAPGTYLPGVMTAGTYRSKGAKDLWLVGRSRTLVVIGLMDQRYDHVVVQVEEPEAAVEALRAALRREHLL